MRYVSHENASDGDMIITVDRRDWLFRTQREQYLGDCTVWHLLPSCTRAPTSIEAQLADIWTRIRYESRATPKESPEP
jgi:hypothetical protein